MDFNTSGWNTPRRLPDIEANPPDFMNDAWSKRLMLADGCSRSRQDARRLEAKVAKVAAKKCSVEEVTTLHKELQEWLTSDVKPNDDVSFSFSSCLCPKLSSQDLLTDVVADTQRCSAACHLDEPCGSF